MSGDWIKMRVDLRDDPAVFKLAEILKVDELHVVGCLFCFWAWADKHAVDGRVDGATSRLVDKVSSTIGFADALVKVGWLSVFDGWIELPNFERHNGASAKERGLKNARQARWRAKRDDPVDASPSTQETTNPSTREEKRREDISTTNVVDGGAREKSRPTRRCPPSFSVTPELRTWASEHAPLVDIELQTAKFMDHTFKASITDWAATWRNWMRKDQEYAADRVSRKHSSAPGETFRERDARHNQELWRMVQGKHRTPDEQPARGIVIDITETTKEIRHEPQHNVG